MPEICFITTCMSRLAHLQETLPTALAQSRASCVVVDYSCPQHCGNWIEQTCRTVRVVRVPNRDRFSPAHARNIGAEAANAPWICFFDADVALDLSFTDAMLPRLRPGHYYRAHPYRDELCGTVICSRDDFARAGGYDVVFQGWGWEDVDLYDRFRLLGLREEGFPSRLVRSIPHGDELRVQYVDVKDLPVSHTVNRIYSQAKLDLMRLKGMTLDIQERRNLYNDVNRFVQLWLQNGQETHLRLAFRKQVSWRLGPEITVSLNYTLS
jgi:glycosyltransferase involved in cell wall biosynthesis